MAHLDYRDVSYGDRGGDQRSYFQNGPVYDANFNDDYFAMKSNKDISKSGDMDTVTIINKPGDPLLDGYNEDALNEPIPEAYPQLTTEQEDFAAKAAEIVQQFATIFPQGPVDVLLTELLKQFSGVPLGCLGNSVKRNIRWGCLRKIVANSRTVSAASQVGGGDGHHQGFARGVGTLRASSV